MKLSGRQNKGLITAIITCFVIMIGVELPLLNNALKGKEKDFNDKLFYVVSSFEDKLIRDSSLMHTINSDDAMIHFVQNNLKTKIDSLFTVNTMPLDYVLAAGKIHNLEVTFGEIEKFRKGFLQSNLIWSGDPKNNSNLISTKVKIGYLGPPANNFYYVKVFFPFKQHFLFRSLLPQFLIVALTLVMMFICFLLLLSIIKKQNMVAQSKDDFISNMTHELKTPLFTISIATKVLKEQDGIKLNNKYLGYLDTIREEAARLLSLTDRLLETSEINKKGIYQEKEKVDVHGILRNAASRLELIRQQNGAELEMSLGANEHYLNGNEKNLETVFVNILDNGLKYSGNNSKIFINTKNDGHNIVISISDNGIGIEPNIKELIFERFFRAHTGYIHNTKGYGIGLSFARSVINLHDGRIKVNSVVGKGSTFIINLPSIN